MFGEVMSRPEVAKLFLEELFGKKIDRVEYINRQQDMSDDWWGHGIRMDVYLADGLGTVYDIEMQKVNKNDLPLRTRYYQSGIDRWTLRKGEHYSQLRESYIIFVCDFDPVEGGGLAMYERKSVLAGNNQEFPYDDRSHVVYLNARYRVRNTNAEVAEYLDVVSGKAPEAPHSELAKAVVEAVTDVRTDTGKEGKYMTLTMKMMDERAEGRAEGRVEGRAEGESLFAQLATRLLALGRVDDVTLAAKDVTQRNRLYAEFGLTPQ